MANSEETFDPNDLESIDALLDEAELEAVESDPVEEPVEEEPVAEVEAQSAPEESAPSDDALETLPDDTEDLLDSLDDLNLDDEPEVVAVSEPEPALEPIPEPVKEKRAPKIDAVPDADDFIERRAAAQAKPNSNISAEDMDSIKKLIIIFGSVLIVFVIAGIGIGVWGALAASSAGVDEETKTLIESIKVSSEKNGGEIVAADKSVKSVEKKLDAINFQLEQLATDIADIQTPVEKAKETTIDPLGLGVQQPNDTTPKQATTPTKPTAAAVASSPELMKKVTSVNSKLIKAQRRIDEVNTRVKKMQAQYQAIMHSVKTVEKQVLIEQAAAAEKAKKEQEKAAKKESYYQYSAPDGGFYDQSVSDSYP